jgi:hypothetical protein
MNSKVFQPHYGLSQFTIGQIGVKRVNNQLLAGNNKYIGYRKRFTPLSHQHSVTPPINILYKHRI